MRLATWNVDHASNSSRPKALQVDQIAQVNPDILVLTETCRELDLSHIGYHSPMYSSQNEYKKHFSAIWTKFPIVRQIPTYDSETAVCAEIGTPIGNIIVYGTIITWHGDIGSNNESPSPQWFEHHKAIQDHGHDWNTLIQDQIFNQPLIVCGDFNQTRDGSKAYCSKDGESIKLLSEQLKRNNLTCVTEEDFGASGKLAIDPNKGYPRSNIDHICMTSAAFDVLHVGAWNHFTESGSYLSDHNGVYVDISKNNYKSGAKAQ